VDAAPDLLRPTYVAAINQAAALAGRTEVVRSLLYRGVRPVHPRCLPVAVADAAFERVRTPVEHGAAAGQLSTLRLLLERRPRPVGVRALPPRTAQLAHGTDASRLGVGRWDAAFRTWAGADREWRPHRFIGNLDRRQLHRKSRP
jgi:hypothetical protein